LKLKQIPYTGKKENTGLASHSATQLYYKRNVKTNSTKPALKTPQNLFQYIYHSLSSGYEGFNLLGHNAVDSQPMLLMNIFRIEK
jgi:hypothetical protein